MRQRITWAAASSNADLRKLRGPYASTREAEQARAAHIRNCHEGGPGDSLPLLPGSSRTAAAASQTGPDDLAAELNPHETELNPHKAVSGG